ncbi:DUF4304 domain-containing protein [Cerasicoccus frondis]|uniref:DUF4304 domain-containing protein n=1 Tax=Cerasicoccus frondis TaxID=490090 RepID=UPI002852B393|nr:DUF4304 domain-containing protein [Cerasicoccus frondis]
MKSPSSKVIDQVLASGPKQFFKETGFRKMARSFIKEVGDLYWVVNFQSSMWNSPESARFTVNLMLVLPYFHEIWTSKPFPKNPGSAAPVCRFRIGLLMPERKDYWWEVDLETDAEQVGNEVTELIASIGLPYLEKATNLEWVIQQLLDEEYFHGCVMNQPLAASILLHHLGKEKKAERVIQSLKKKNTHEGFGKTITTIESRIKTKDVNKAGGGLS